MANKVFEDEDFDFDEFDEEEAIHTFTQVADASVQHMKVAFDLTKLIVETRKAGELSADDILNIFKKSAETVMESTPLKALFDKT